MKRVGLFWTVLLLVLLLVSGAFATDVETVVVDNNIGPDEFAEFEVTITNDGSGTSDFILYSISSNDGWQVDAHPLSDKVIEDLPVGESREVLVRATPIEDDLDPGIYQLNLDVESSYDGEVVSVPLKVYLGSGVAGGEYLPSIAAEIEMDSRIRPTEPVSVVLYLRNGNLRDLSDLSLRIESDIEEFNVNIPISLLPSEEKTTEFTLELDAFTQPKDYVLFFTFEHGGETVKVVDQKVTVEMYVPDFSVEVQEQKTFLRKDVTVLLLNEGNAENTQEYLYPLGFLSSFFVSNSEGKVARIDGSSYVVFDVQVAPGESKPVSLTLNYRVLFYLLFFGLALLGLYFLLRSPVSISKRGMVVIGDDDGLSEVKVLLEVKNKRGVPLSEIDILDHVPGIANVERTLQLGTLKPDKVTHAKQGSKIHWSLKELDAHEQRIITYRVKAKLSILGKFQLPRAELMYTSSKGKRKKSYSNLFLVDTSSIQK